MAEAATRERLYTVEEYLAMEMTSDVKHEYVDGHVFAMTGTGKAHDRIAGNIFARLRAVEHGTRCQVYIAEIKARSSRTRYYYPDVMVTCRSGPGDPYVEDEPCFLVEVLSPTTEGIDRREKMIACRGIPSLRA